MAKKNKSLLKQQKSKLKNESKPSNPFEKKISKEKFKVMGRNIKGEQNIAEARAKAYQNRKETLLKEFEHKEKKGSFIDSRIGEGNSNISEEEKALLRFMKTSKKRFGKKKFQLDEEEENLTHLGASIGEIETFRDDYVGSDEEEGGDISGNQVNNLHFGGFQSDPDKPKTRNEIIKEIVAKSKMHKHQRAKEKAEQAELLEKLDMEFKDILHLIPNIKRTTKDPMRTKSDDFDELVHILQSEVRAQPTDRLKTPEEIAKEEKLKLERLERERIQRMNPDYEESKSKQIGGDDLEDNFDIGEGYDPKKEFSQESLNIEDLKETKEKTKSESEESGSEETQNDQVNRIEKTVQQAKKKDTEGTKEENTIDTSEIPFTFGVPEDYSQFLSWIKNRSLKDKALIIHRIKTCNNIKLSSSNREKIQKFFNILLERFDDLCSQSKYPKNEVNMIYRSIFDLSQQIPNYVCQVVKERLFQMNSNLLQALRDKQSAWNQIQLKDFMFIKMLSNIFPITDFQHPIITPCQLFMAQYLSQCQITSKLDTVKGLFLCNLFFHYVSLSKKFSPEVINFLFGLLASFTNTCHKSCFNIPLQLFPTLSKDMQESKLQTKLNIDFFITQESVDDETISAFIFKGTISLLSQFSSLYFSHSTYPEIFGNGLSILEYFQSSNELPPFLLSCVANLKTKIESNTEKSIRKRKPLTLFKHKVGAIKELKPLFQLNPHLEEDPKEEQKKLKKKYKKELKGAIREIRRDNYFLDLEKSKKRKLEVEEREERRKKITTMLEEEQREKKQYDKAKQSLKKRSIFK